MNEVPSFTGPLVIEKAPEGGLVLIALVMAIIFAIGAIISLIVMFRNKKQNIRLRAIAGFWICLVMAAAFYFMPWASQLPRESLWAYVKLGQSIVWLAAIILVWRVGWWFIKFAWWVFSFGALRGAKFPRFPWDDKLKFALTFAIVFAFIGWTYPWMLSLAMPPIEILPHG